MSEYIELMEKVHRLREKVAYWQPSKNDAVEMGFEITPFRGRIRFGGIEKIFDRVRPKQYPSRLGSVMVSPTKDNILFDKGKPIYECVVSGKVFYGDLRLFTEAVHSKETEEIEAWAKKYWVGSRDINERYTEMLVDGTAIVIGEI